MSNNDWRARMDRDLKQREEAYSRRYQEQERKQAEKERREAERKLEKYNEMLAEHQRRFKCHICGTPSSGPARSNKVIGTRRYERSDYPDDDDIIEEIYADDWNKPTDLEKCSICGKWTCSQHLHRGVCEKDYSKGFLPR